MAELDYRPNALARSLGSGKTKTIAFMVPSVSNPIFGDNTIAIEEYASAKGYSVFIANTRGSQSLADSYCDRLIEMHVEGVLITLTWENARKELVARLQNRGIKVVGCSGSRVVASIDCFSVDEYKAGCDLGRYLVGLEHRQCAYVGVKDSIVSELRLQGLQKAFADVEAEIPAPLISWAASAQESDREEAMYNLLGQGKTFTSIVAANDLLATTVLSVMTRHGINIPGKMSLATFGDHYTRLTVPQITTMAHSDFEMGKHAITRLFEIIEHDDGQPVNTILNKRLIIRESTAVKVNRNTNQ